MRSSLRVRGGTSGHEAQSEMLNRKSVAAERVPDKGPGLRHHGIKGVEAKIKGIEAKSFFCFCFARPGHELLFWHWLLHGCPTRDL